MLTAFLVFLYFVSVTLKKLIIELYHIVLYEQAAMLMPLAAIVDPHPLVHDVLFALIIAFLVVPLNLCHSFIIIFFMQCIVAI